MPDEDYEFYQEKPKEMTDTSQMFYNENTVEFNKVDKQSIAMKHSDTMADAMLFQSEGSIEDKIKKLDQEILGGSIVEEQDYDDNKK